MSQLVLDEATLAHIEAAKRPPADPAATARRLIGMLDLTSLNDDDQPATIAALAARAVTPHGPVAALCVFPAFVAQARQLVDGTGIRIATVINFPGGEDGPELVHDTTAKAVADGASEIDLVFPYKRFLADAPPPASRTLRTCRDAAGFDVRIKVILETGAYGSTDQLSRAADVAIDGGADFLKTSTGKIAAGATLEAAAILLAQIDANGLPVGFKASGGVRSFADAAAYLALADSMLGAGWATPACFRIGASSLLDELLAVATR